MGKEERYLKAVAIAIWGGAAVVAVWLTQRYNNESALALTGGFVLLASLMLSRYALGLAFTSSPLLYLGLLGIFHFGLVVPWALGIYNLNRVSWFDPYGLSHGIRLVVYSVIAYQVGLLLSFGRGVSSSTRQAEGRIKLESSELFAVGLFLFLVAVSMFVAGLVSLDPSGYYRLTYSETFRLRAESDPRFFGSGMTIGSIALCLAFAGASRLQLKIAFLCAGVWVLALFYLGFRGPALIAGLIACVLALKKGVTFPRWAPWVAVAILLVAVPVERVIREEPLNQRSFFSTLQNLNILDAPAEMGTSIRPLVETADLIDATNYRFGRTYLIGVEGILPNLALRWENSSTESLDNLPPSHWITAVTDPWTYRTYGGMGFSAVAEPYMNFGPVGMIVFFLGIAFILVRLEQVSFRNAYALAAWGLILGPLLWTTRNDFSNFFRPAIWGVACLVLVRMFSGGYSSIKEVWWRDELRPKTQPREPRPA
ncbi:MAG TPA: O-antigen polysaccharide polymerase Wzy [Candidatus Limnocylindrales bacterium]|nr:O-antigen polysaccharide polymerase Wzy [Candidatus Limnocylindrales bacterium]